MSREPSSRGDEVSATYDWVARYRAEGEVGLQDRPSRPHRSPQRLRRPVRRRIGKLRRARRSLLEIADALALPLSTVVTEQRRQGLNRLPPLPPPPVVRYERARPGELVHVDTKKLGRFWRPGHRAHGSRRHRNTGARWEILFVAIDDETAVTAAGFFERARAWFGLHGIVIDG